MLQVIKTMLGMLTASDRQKTWPILVLTVSMALFETLGIASVMPFIAVLANPEVVHTNRYLAALENWLSFDTRTHFLLFLGTVSFVLLLAGTALRAATLWAQLEFGCHQSHRFALRLIAGYLFQPYQWFLNRHTAQLSTDILSEVGNVIQTGYFPAMSLISNAIVSVCVLSLLLWVDPALAIATAAMLAGAYIGVYFAIKKRIACLGEARIQANRERYRAVAEAFGGIKEVKISGTEQSFVQKFEAPSSELARKSVSVSVISELPSFAMQATVSGGIVLMLLYLLTRYGSVQGALPIVALFALAGYRLMPALQGIYRSAAQLRVIQPAVTALKDGLNHATVRDLSISAEGPHPTGSGRMRRLGLRRSLAIEALTYKYPEAKEPALVNVNVEIFANSIVAFVGPTGSGKTTIIDIVLGLLEPSSGRVVVDGHEVTAENRRDWQRSIGYVPQTIFLLDDTIAANIAMGIPESDVDREAVIRASKAAQLHEFVVESLPAGYDTQVGERGVRLSGGQRQRIGIARALFHDPDLLVLDEATSALDNVTEHEVVQSILDMARKKTIILIAHRLSTVKQCDTIFVVERGAVVAHGRYEDLAKSDEIFREMVTRS
jgi:ABC-type multidrug transport system fused ATPase/permease subunit